MMNETSLMVLLFLLFIAVLLVQHLRFKKKYVGYKDIQDAIQQEFRRLTSLRQEIKAGVELVEDSEVKLVEAIKQKNEVQASFEKLQSAHAELERANLRVRCIRPANPC
jgi:predicted DNA-binding helix-hairpin-helix protein